MRVRQFSATKNIYRDWTIRCKSRYGYTTEIDKLRAGWGDFYFYGWDNANGRIDEYMLLDLAKVRNSGLLSTNIQRKITVNTDGKTAFITISTSELFDHGCFLVHTLRNLPLLQLQLL